MLADFTQVSLRVFPQDISHWQLDWQCWHVSGLEKVVVSCMFDK